MQLKGQHKFLISAYQFSWCHRLLRDGSMAGLRVFKSWNTELPRDFIDTLKSALDPFFHST
jgi:hypothetical protein